MNEITWMEYWGMKLRGYPEISEDITQVLSGVDRIISDHLYQYPPDNPTSVNATHDCIFIVEGQHFRADKDQTIVVYGDHLID